MSENRDKDKDRAATLRVLENPGRTDPYLDEGNASKNWLGHFLTAKTSQLDEMLIKGAEINDMKRVRGAIVQHIRHLSVEHGLSVKRDCDGKYRINVGRVGSVSGRNESTIEGLIGTHQEERYQAFEAMKDTRVVNQVSNLVEAIRYHGSNSNPEGVYQKIRPLHDKFLWMAKDDALCQGAVYRTEGFMRMPKHEKCGDLVNQTVHIEHTIPVAAIRDCITKWRNEKGSPFSFDEIYEAVMTISICTAMDMPEKAGGTRKGLNSRNPAVEELSWKDLNNDEVLRHCKPFQRYEDHIGIYDVIAGKKIDKNEFSLRDHKRRFREYLELLS